ncbi:MAG: hypothetical protein U0V56_11420 [Actinomycetota bacterium]
MSRRAVAVSGAAAVLAYVALAIASAELSPLARGPMLDGLGPLAPYRWVTPPPELAATNQPPSSGRFDVTLGPAGSEAATFVLSDNQATFILPDGAFPTSPGQVQVRLRVDPVDPATLGAAPDGLTVFGNAYRLRATYVPDGRPVEGLLAPIDTFLVYPVTAELQSPNHRLATSEDGRTWTVQEGTDSHALQQAEGPVPTLGYVQVVGELGAPSPSVAPGGGNGSSRTIALGLLVAAVCVGLVGAGLILRSRSSAGSSRSPRSGGRTSRRR